MRCLYPHRSQKCEKDCQVDSPFTLLRSALVKAFRKMLVKSIPVYVCALIPELIFNYLMIRYSNFKAGFKSQYPTFDEQFAETYLRF